MGSFFGANANRDPKPKPPAPRIAAARNSMSLCFFMHRNHVFFVLHIFTNTVHRPQPLFIRINVDRSKIPIRDVIIPEDSYQRFPSNIPIKDVYLGNITLLVHPTEPIPFIKFKIASKATKFVRQWQYIR